MSTQELRSIVRRFFAAFEVNDQATLEALLAPDFLAYLPGDTGPVNREAFLDIIRNWAAAFSELKFGIEQEIAEQNVVATHLTLQGVHDRGDFLDLPPLGNRFAITVMTTERIADGQIVEHRVVFNLLDLTQQLGAIHTAR